MELTSTVKVDERQQQLMRWLESILSSDLFLLSPVTGDASFRRYFRVLLADKSWIVMDAPPSLEKCETFVTLAKALREKGVFVPEVIEANIDQGFLLLSDFGDTTYLNGLTHHNADQLYRRALIALSDLQACTDIPVPVFGKDWMLNEWQWHKEWFLTKLLNITLPRDLESSLDSNFNLIVESALIQPQVFMHRDYHSANLMMIPSKVGILDFQDAFIGPVTYDLVSLLRDCYIAWPNGLVTGWALEYFELLQARGQLKDVSHATFLRWFDWMGLERHLKALFTFARKHVRDKQSQYLNHVPRTLNYILHVTQCYPELEAMHAFYKSVVVPATEEMGVSCVQ